MSGEASRKALLVCGIASSLLYALMIWTIRYEGYNLVSQVPSELTAIGAPTQRLWVLLGPIYTLLVAAFGWGIWRSAGENFTVRLVGGLVLAYASLGLLWPFAPMHQREVLAAGGGTLSDTMHVALGGVTVFLMFLAIGFGARAFGKRFRLYSIGSIVVLLAFGALTFVDASRLQANLPTPWIGLWERSTSAYSCCGSWCLPQCCCGKEHQRRVTSCLPHLRSRPLKVKPSSSPYFCPSQDPKWYATAESVPGPTTELMQEYAKKYQMVIIVPIYERNRPVCYTTPQL